ncbi:hypothetical protein CPB85DRAFT_1336611, partial [Mucidula mucida]
CVYAPSQTLCIHIHLTLDNTFLSLFYASPLLIGVLISCCSLPDKIHKRPL